MIDIDNFVIFLVIENTDNKGNGNSEFDDINKHYNIARNFFEEAKICLSHWRKNGGIYKDIKIYVLCMTSNTISRNEISYLTKKYNIIYLENYIKNWDDYPAGYFLTPYAGKYIEDNYKQLNLNLNTLILHFDLDMVLMTSPNLENLLPNENENAAIQIYDEEEFEELTDDLIKTYKTVTFNTGFILSYIYSNFYNNWTKSMELDFYTYIKENVVDTNNYHEYWKYCNIEESSVNNIKNTKYIKPITNIEFRDYNYDKSPMFLHCHYNLSEFKHEYLKIFKFLNHRRMHGNM